MSEQEAKPFANPAYRKIFVGNTETFKSSYDLYEIATNKKVVTIDLIGDRIVNVWFEPDYEEVKDDLILNIQDNILFSFLLFIADKIPKQDNKMVYNFSLN